MKDIVNIKITPVKNIMVNSVVESFNPNEYTPEQVNKLRLKGYTESSETTTLDTEDTTEDSQMMRESSKSKKDTAGKKDMKNNKENKEASKRKQLTARDRLESGDSAETVKFFTDLIQNKQFIKQSREEEEKLKKMNEKMLAAEKKFTNLKNELKETGMKTSDDLQNQYEDRIRKWTENYQKSVTYYKQYIQQQQDALKQLQIQNASLSESMTKNTQKMSEFSKKWDKAQDRINKLEKQLLESGNIKYDAVIKSLKDQLAAEKIKQSSIDEKIAILRAEKQQLDSIFAENIEKMKQAGVGSNCPKGVNMNDYIHKKKIPCWGCIL